MSVSLWQDRAQQKITKDIVIIGGGVAGLSAAYWLSEADPDLNIALVEKYELASGATGRNAGFITCGSVEHFNRLVEKHGRDEASEIWKFSETNLELLKEHIIQDKAEELLFRQQGSFSLAATAVEFDELKKSAELMKSFNINVETVEETEIVSRLDAHGFVGGIKYCDDGEVHPVRLIDTIVKRLEEKSRKVEIYLNNEVYEVATHNDMKFIKTQKHHFEAPIVVYATNGYSKILHPFFEDKVFPTRGQILALEPTEPFMEGPCYANFVLDYFRQLPTGELVIGGFRQIQKDVEVGLSDETSEIIQNALEDFVRKHLPRLSQAKVTHRWSGVMGFSVDGQPMIGALPSDPQSFFSVGFTAHGIGLAFHAGKCLADALFDRPIPGFISAKRFS